MYEADLWLQLHCILPVLLVLHALLHGGPCDAGQAPVGHERHDLRYVAEPAERPRSRLLLASSGATASLAAHAAAATDDDRHEDEADETDPPLCLADARLAHFEQPFPLCEGILVIRGVSIFK